VNIWKEIIKTGSGLVSKDDMLSVELALKQFFGQSAGEKSAMSHRATAAFQEHFQMKKVTAVTEKTLLSLADIHSREA
jgi:hypothetical protein